MSEEEKKAIEKTKAILKEWQKIVEIEDPEERNIEMSCYIEEMPFFEMKTLLKIIKKQQKEIESLKIIHETYKEEMKSIEDRYISKDKIKEKIKKIGSETQYLLNDKGETKQNYAIRKFNELLEEK